MSFVLVIQVIIELLYYIFSLIDKLHEILRQHIFLILKFANKCHLKFLTTRSTLSRNIA